MKQVRGGDHTTLTETAALVVGLLRKMPAVIMIAPGIINQNTKHSGKRFITAVFTTAGMELLITGQGSQKVAVHCNQDLAPHIFHALSLHKKLSDFTFKSRERKPGI